MVLQHIQSLFHEPIQWDHIEKYYPDMLRTAMSIKAGKITASTILWCFGTKNRKNKLYFAFRELGRVVRTMFLRKDACFQTTQKMSFLSSKTTGYLPVRY